MINPKDYRKKISEAITKFYKKASTSDTEKINEEAKNIKAKLDISDRVQKLCRKHTFFNCKGLQI